MSRDNGFRPGLEAEIRRIAERDQAQKFRAEIFEEEGRAIVRGVAATDLYLFPTPPPGEYTVQSALALGAAMVLGKTIVVMNFGDRKPPPDVEKIAVASFHMINNPLTDDGKAEFERKFAKVIRQLEEEKT